MCSERTCRVIRASLMLVFMLAGVSMNARASWQSWPIPPLPSGTHTQNVARRIVFNGLDMRAQLFRSSQSPQDIVAFYRRAWKGRVVVNRVGDQQVIGHNQGDYFVTIQVQGAGAGSKGNIGVVDVASAPRHFVPGKGVPTPMGSKVFNDIAYPDDPVPARMVALRNTLSPRQNASFYRERLAGDGWKPQGDRCDTAACVLSYQREEEKMTLVITRVHDDQSQVVALIQQPK
jgi:hypothetical protein